MEVALKDIFNAKPALEKIFNQEMPAKTSFKIADLIDIIAPEFDKIEKVRMKLVNKYLEEGEQSVQKNFEDFSKDFSEFLQEKAEISYEPAISFDEIPEEVRVTPVELRKIRFLFKA